MEKSWGLVFGPGIVDAYDLESKVARYPRIVVDQKVFDELSFNRRLWTRTRDGEVSAVAGLLRTDKNDGTRFLDYLKVVQAQLRPDAYRRFVESHEQRIGAALTRYAGDQRVGGKYAWLHRYHRDTMASA